MVNTLLVGLGSLIGSIIAIVGIIVILHYLGVLTVILHALQQFFDWIRHGITWINLTAPKGLKVFLFIFFISVMGSVVVSSIISLDKVCVDNNLREINYGIIGGIGMNIYEFFVGYDDENTTNDLYVSWLLNNTHIDEIKDVKSAEGMFYIKCVGDNPILTLWGLDIFNFRYWVMIFLIGFVISILWRD